MSSAREIGIHSPGIVTRGRIDDVTSLRVFSLVVETESFTEAGRRMGFTPATISKHVSGLEQRLGSRLINRTTRRLHVTEAGHIFYQRCVNVLQELERAESELSEIRKEPTGHLRVTVPTVLAVRHISPHLSTIMETYPKLSVELVLNSSKMDLFNEGIDLAIRIATQIEPGLIAIKLAPNRRVFAAAPAYLARHGVPQTPEELMNHNCLVARGLSLNNNWLFKRDGQNTTVRVGGNLIADNGEVLLDAALAGLGVIMLPTFLASDSLRTGKLVPILSDYTADPVWIHAVLPHRQYIPLKARCFIDFLKQRFGKTPYWDEPPASAGKPLVAQETDI